MVAASPLLLLPLGLPSDVPEARERLDYCTIFLFHNHLPADALLLAARAMLLLLGFFMAWILWSWGLETLGPVAAGAALLYFATCPPLLAFAHLVTTDFAFTVAFLAALWGFWKFLRRPESYSSALLAGTGLGVALNVKYSAVSLMVIFPCLFLLEQPWKAHRPGRLLRGLGMMGAVSLCLCIPFYGFQWRAVLDGFRTLHYYSLHGWSGYLVGRYSREGWPWYFVAVLLFKTPFVLLTLSAGSPLLVRPSPARRFLAVWVFIPSLLFLIIVSFSRIQVGVRHILPLYPLLCLAAGAATAALWNGGWIARLAASGALLGSLCVSATAYPHYIAYFGALAGGSSNGYRMLADSNCDWGQELKALAIYLRRVNAGPIYLSYFGCADPAHYGIQYQALAPVVGGPLRPDVRVDVRHAKTVLFGISATNRQGIYYQRPHIFNWLETRRPVQVLGHTFFIYDITKDAAAHREIASLYAEEGLRERAAQELAWAGWIESGSPR